MTADGGGRRRAQAKPPGPDRFDAIIHARRGTTDLAPLEGLQLDRLPDRYGRLRALVTAEECGRLLDLGYEVRLRRHHPVKPLDPRLVATNDSVQRWIKERLSEIRPAAETPKPTTRRKR